MPDRGRACGSWSTVRIKLGAKVDVVIRVGELPRPPRRALAISDPAGDAVFEITHEEARVGVVDWLVEEE